MIKQGTEMDSFRKKFYLSVRIGQMEKLYRKTDETFFGTERGQLPTVKGRKVHKSNQNFFTL